MVIIIQREEHNTICDRDESKMCGLREVVNISEQKKDYKQILFLIKKDYE
jgi:hypothetical protein